MDKVLGFPRTHKLNLNHQWLHTINPNSTKTQPKVQNLPGLNQNSIQTNPKLDPQTYLNLPKFNLLGLGVLGKPQRIRIE